MALALSAALRSLLQCWYSLISITGAWNSAYGSISKRRLLVPSYGTIEPRKEFLINIVFVKHSKFLEIFPIRFDLLQKSFMVFCILLVKHPTYLFSVRLPPSLKFLPSLSLRFSMLVKIQD